MLRQFRKLLSHFWNLLCPTQKQNNKERKLSIRIPLERETSEWSSDFSEFSEIDLHEQRNEKSTIPHQTNTTVRK